MIHASLADSQRKNASLNLAIDDFIAQLTSRPNEDVESLLADFPEHADELRRLLPSMRMLVSLQASEAGCGVTSGSDLNRELGDFRILRELGRGGMGVVYEAEQLSLGSRRVALKVLPFAGMLDDRQLRRFKLEAAAAAILKHPHIVSIISIGFDRGVNYYAMELIEGLSLADLIESRKATKAKTERPAKSAADTPHALHDTTARHTDFFRAVATLGVQAAEALDHAHQQGIVHRDVKPSNLMLDAAGNVFVTDFGLAHIEASPGITLTGDLIGTLRYMSPEQASGRNAYVDPRTDVYSLGATLYELATDRPAVQGQDRATMVREIVETEPASPRTHTPAMSVDLETILLKCLAKEPSARYETAKALADDLRRFLDQKPIVARRPRLFDTLAKSARRHKVVVAATAIVIATLVAGVVGTSLGWLRAERAEQTAKDERDRADDAKRLAEEEAEASRAVSQFLEEALLLQASPDFNPVVANLTVKELLDRASSTIETSFSGRPKSEAAIRKTMGDAYTALGEYSAAQLHLERAYALYKQEDGERGIQTLDTLSNLAEAYRSQGDLEKAEPLATMAVDLSREVLGEAHPDTLVSMNNLATIYFHLDKPDLAQRLFESVLAEYESRGERSSQDGVSTMNNLATLYSKQGRDDEAGRLLKECLELSEVGLGPEHPETLISLNNLAVFYKDQRRYAEAEPLFLRGLDLRSRVNGEDAPATLVAMNNLASLWHDRGELTRAESLFTDTLERVRRVEGPTHPHARATAMSLIDVRLQLELYREAEQLARTVMEDFRKAEGPDSLKAIVLSKALAESLLGQGKAAEAETTLRAFLAAFPEPPDIWEIAHAHSLLGEALSQQGDHLQAEPLLLAAYERLKTEELEAPPQFKRVLRLAAKRLVDLYRLWEKPEAEAKWRSVLVHIDTPLTPEIETPAPRSANGREEVAPAVEGNP
jgi:serine/threonine protein kinase/tetratricopeptide (TPR) repeat protein